MFVPVNEVAVLVSAILALAIGSIWYSPFMFGNQWMRSAGLTQDDIELPKGQMLKTFVYAVIANIVTLFLVAQFIVLSSDALKPAREVGLLLVILLGSVMANVVIWEKKPASYLFVNLGYATVVIFTGIAVIGYWPW